MDGQIKSTVSAGNDKEVQKASVTGFDTSRIHRVSVKSLGGPGPTKKMSNEAACTMVIGKDAPLGPTGNLKKNAH